MDAQPAVPGKFGSHGMFGTGTGMEGRAEISVTREWMVIDGRRPMRGIGIPMGLLGFVVGGAIPLYFLLQGGRELVEVSYATLGACAIGGAVLFATLLTPKVKHRTTLGWGSIMDPQLAGNKLSWTQVGFGVVTVTFTCDPGHEQALAALFDSLPPTA